MTKLIQIELKKILKHKSIYIILFIITLFCFANNYFISNEYDDLGRYKYTEVSNIDQEIKRNSTNLEKYNKKDPTNYNTYATLTTKITLLKIKKTFEKHTWQYQKIEDYLTEDLYNYNYYILTNNPLATDYQKNYQIKLNYLKNNNYKYFLNLEKELILNNLEEYTQSSSKITNESNYKKLKKELKIINYRLKNNIPYNDDYLNNSLVTYYTNMEKLDNYPPNNLSYTQKITKQNLLKEANISKYIVDNKLNLNKINTSNYLLRDILDDYELFIIIIILITTSILIGEEFTKGTIKLLLIKPYRRNKILLSKILTSLIILILSILFLITIQIIISTLIFDTSTLKDGVCIYNFTTNSTEVINLFAYLVLRVIAKLPVFIMLILLSTLLGVIINNSFLPFSITILIYTFSEVINNLILNSKTKLFTYLLTPNWNFTCYLFGSISKYEYINFKKSISIYLFYVIITLVLTFTIFQKKNIKNL